MSFGSPVPRPSKVVQGWGEPREYRDGTHEGFDYPVGVGTPVYAVGDGTVISAGTSSDAAGSMIAVEHPEGIISRYLHLDTRLVQKGAKVTKGQVIARSGASGIKRSAAHLHFDLKVRPEKLATFAARYGTPAGGFPPVRYGLVGVPAEPVIPVDVYAPRVRAGAARFGIPLYAAVAGSVGLAAVLLGAGGFLVWRSLKKP